MENNQPVSPAPQDLQDVLPQTPPQEFFLKRINKKILIIIGFILGLILVFLISFFVFFKKNNQPVVVPVKKTWEIVFSYNPSKDSFVLTRLTLLNKQIKPDYRSAKFSEFKLNVLNTNGKILYSTNVVVMTELLDGNLLTEAYSSGSAKASAISMQNILYAPHFEDEKTITLTRDGKVVLELVVPVSKKNLP